MKRFSMYASCIIFAIILVILSIHYVSISFKPDRISRELYKNLSKTFDKNGMIVDISNCLDTEWDSIYVTEVSHPFVGVF